MTRAAFTLLEILVAVSLFMLIMGAILGCWKAVVNGTKIGIEAAAAAQRARIGIRTIEDALSTSEISTANLDYYSFLADTSEKFAALSLTSRLPDSFPGSNLFGDNVVRRVTFTVEKGANNENDLVMTQSPLLVVPSIDNQPYPIVLARDVSFFKLEFWSPKENDWMTEFLATNQFPKMIRVTLGVGHSSQNPNIPYELVTRTVAMPSVAH